MPDPEITDEDRAFLQAEGMVEVEPGRWVGGWQDMDGNAVSIPDSTYLDSLLNAGREMSARDAELGGADAYIEPVEPERLLGDYEDDSPVGLPLGVREEHVGLFAGLDKEAFREAVERLYTDRPALTMDAAARDARADRTS